MILAIYDIIVSLLCGHKTQYQFLRQSYFGLIYPSCLNH